MKTLLHAFLPYKYVDHTHANAILSLIDQPQDIKICQDTFGNKIGIVPYIIPGFELAKKSLEIFKKNKNIEGLILLNHGIFSFGNNAEESYKRMIDLVSIAEKKLNKDSKNFFFSKSKKKHNNIFIESYKLLPLLRNCLSTNEGKEKHSKWILEIRNNKKILDYLNHPKLNKFTQKGPVTPDHVIRIKPKPLVIDIQGLEAYLIEKFIKKEINKFRKNYHKYFLKNKKHVINAREIDSNPRLLLMPGIGIIGIGKTSKEAKIASDLAECTFDVVSKAESFGKFTPISEKEIFKVEYWPLEQAKVNNIKRPSLTSNVTVISGGCGTIGLATARKFHQEGSEIVLLDNNLKNITNTPNDVKKFANIIECNVTNNQEVKRAFHKVCNTFGGMDILISNAGAAWQGNIGTVSEKILKESFDLNFFAHQYLSQESINIFLTQKTSGLLLYNISKQSINPGLNFGPYGLPKASTLFLMRQYTLEYGKYGIRANGVNADRIRSGILTDSMISQRSKSRNLSKKNYMEGNLLKSEILPEDVAEAFLSLVKSKKTTGNVLTVDGGNMSAIMR